MRGSGSYKGLIGLYKEKIGFNRNPAIEELPSLHMHTKQISPPKMKLYPT